MHHHGDCSPTSSSSSHRCCEAAEDISCLSTFRWPRPSHHCSHLCYTRVMLRHPTPEAFAPRGTAALTGAVAGMQSQGCSPGPRLRKGAGCRHSVASLLHLALHLCQQLPVLLSWILRVDGSSGQRRRDLLSNTCTRCNNSSVLPNTAAQLKFPSCLLLTSYPPSFLPSPHSALHTSSHSSNTAQILCLILQKEV